MTKPAQQMPGQRECRFLWSILGVFLHGHSVLLGTDLCLSGLSERSKTSRSPRSHPEIFLVMLSPDVSPITHLQFLTSGSVTRLKVEGRAAASVGAHL